MGLRDLNAPRQPGAEPALELDISLEDVVVPEYAADLSQEELVKLVAARKARQLEAVLPSDLPGSGTRPDDGRRH